MSDTRWEPPEWVRARADAQRVAYEDPGPWDNGAHCGGSSKPGRTALGQYLRARFGGVTDIGGYACRPNTANTRQMSAHGTGRALDVHCAGADGDAVAAWLVDNAERLGVCYLIWRRTQFNASKPPGQKFRPYTGPNPHTDHVHVELSTDGAMARTRWFSDGGPESAPYPDDEGDTPHPGRGLALVLAAAAASLAVAAVVSSSKGRSRRPGRQAPRYWAWAS